MRPRHRRWRPAASTPRRHIGWHRAGSSASPVRTPRRAANPGSPETANRQRVTHLAGGYHTARRVRPSHAELVVTPERADGHRRNETRHSAPCGRAPITTDEHPREAGAASGVDTGGPRITIFAGGSRRARWSGRRRLTVHEVRQQQTVGRTERGSPTRPRRHAATRPWPPLCIRWHGARYRRKHGARSSAADSRRDAPAAGDDTQIGALNEVRVQSVGLGVACTVAVLGILLLYGLLPGHYPLSVVPYFTLIAVAMVGTVPIALLPWRALAAHATWRCSPCRCGRCSTSPWWRPASA